MLSFQETRLCEEVWELGNIVLMVGRRNTRRLTLLERRILGDGLDELGKAMVLQESMLLLNDRYGS